MHERGDIIEMERRLKLKSMKRIAGGQRCREVAGDGEKPVLLSHRPSFNSDTKPEYLRKFTSSDEKITCNADDPNQKRNVRKCPTTQRNSRSGIVSNELSESDVRKSGHVDNVYVNGKHRNASSMRSAEVCSGTECCNDSVIRVDNCLKQFNESVQCYESDSDTESEMTDSNDSDGVTLHIINYQDPILISRNTNPKAVNHSLRASKNVAKSVSPMSGNSARIIIGSPQVSPVVPSKSPLKKSKSLNLETNGLKLSTNCRNNTISKEARSSCNDLKPVRTVNTIVGSPLKLPHNCDVSGGIVEDVSSCIDGSMSSFALLDTIAENSNNSNENILTSDRGFYKKAHDFNLSSYSSMLLNKSSKFEKFSPPTPILRIQHSKSDIHIPVSADSPSVPPRRITPSLGDQPSSTTVRRSKSRNEGQIFGIRIDSFSGVRRLGHLTKRSKTFSAPRGNASNTCETEGDTKRSAPHSNERLGDNITLQSKSCAGENGIPNICSGSEKCITENDVTMSGSGKPNVPPKSVRRPSLSVPQQNKMNKNSPTKHLERNLLTKKSFNSNTINVMELQTNFYVNKRNSLALRESDSEISCAPNSSSDASESDSSSLLRNKLHHPRTNGDTSDLNEVSGKRHRNFVSTTPRQRINFEGDSEVDGSRLTIASGKKSSTNADSPSLGSEASASGTVGGAFKRCVQLLRSRSAVSQRDRPNFSLAPSRSGLISSGGSKVAPNTAKAAIGPDTSYEKACGSDRRGSAPATPILGGGRSPLHARNDNASPNGGVGGGGPNTPSQGRLANFFSKRSIKHLPLKRTKSVTKIERSKRGGTGGPLSSNQNLESNHNDETNIHSEYPAYQQPSHHLSSTNLHGTGLVNGSAGPDTTNGGGLATRLRSSQSHESLLSSRDHQMMSTLDLTAGEAIIRPLHDSVLGQRYCFQIKAPNGTRYYSCRSEHERDKWVESLRRAINPYADSKSRVHNSINITIVEAKGIPPKKQYFCELRLDDEIYGRTSAKTKNDLCFWGEQFEFKCLPTVHTATIILWREPNKRKTVSRDVGMVQIPVSSVTGRNVIEKWYPLQPGSAASSKNTKNVTPSIRIKCSYQTVNILPINMYQEFHDFLLTNYSGICSLLEPVVSVTTKADVATTLVHLTQHSQLATTLISDIVLEEIAKNDDSHLIFRGNSVGTKAMEAFMKLVGENYLRETLEPAITKIIMSQHDCEVDPKKVSNEALIPKNRKNLISHVKMTWNRIIQSPLYFPLELRECFRLFRCGLTKLSKESLGDKLISASIFLRFLCPAILNPILFRLTHELPNEKVTRNLTLVAKTLQTLANFTKFQGKEEFMEFMNDFIEKEQSEMKEFLRKISSERASDVRVHGYGGNIDPGIQLSVLQTLLAECLPNLKPETDDEIRHRDTLKRLIDDLDRSKDNPNNDLVQTLASHEGSGSASNSTTATLVDHQKRDDRLNLHGIKDNVFRYNDPTSGSFSTKHSASSCHVDGLERDAKPQNTDLTDRPGRRNEVLSPKSNFSSQKEIPATSRSSTLPRSSYLVGSGRTPAMDLHTDDDYVHYSALNSDNDNTMPKGGQAIGHSYSQSHIPPDSPSTAPFQQGHRNHHRHFHNHTALFNSTNNGMNGSVYNSSFSQMSNCNQNQQQQMNPLHANDSLNSSQDCEQSDTNMKGSQTSISQLSNVVSSGYQSFAYSQSSSPVDPTITDVANNNSNSAFNGSPNNNNRTNGNHIQHKSSTSNHISNRYLNEPISVAQMPQITQVKQPTAQVALAFNNPTYQMESLATSSPRSNNKIHPKQNLHHHFLVNGSVLPHSGRAYPLSHSQSSHAASYSSSPTSARTGFNGNQCNSSLSSAQSVEDLVCNRVTLSGSDDTSSLVSTTSTPPQSAFEINSRLNYNPSSNGYVASHTQPAHRIHAHNSYKSSAPRTNPRCLPTPAWHQPQSATTNLHSSINNLSKTEKTKNPPLDHHHSTSDLLSTSSYSQPRRPAHKSARRQSAELGSTRQRFKTTNNYDSTSDDTSGDERPPIGSGSSQHRSRHGGTVPAPLNRVSVKRSSDNKTLEDYENDIMSMKKMLENLENEVKEQQDQKDSPDPVNTASSLSCNASNLPPSSASMQPVAGRPADGRISLSSAPFRSTSEDRCVGMLRDHFDEVHEPPVTHLAHAEPTEELVRQLLEDQAKKDAVIAAQKEQISTLDVSNNRLLQAYNDLSQRLQMVDFEALDPQTAAAFMEASAAAGLSIRRGGGGSSADGSKYSDPSPHSSDYNGSSC